MNPTHVVIAISLLIQAVVLIFKQIFPNADKSAPWLWPVVSVGLGVLFCITANADVFAMLEIKLGHELVGYVTTGIISSGGPNFLHEVLNSIKKSVSINNTINNTATDKETKTEQS